MTRREMSMKPRRMRLRPMKRGSHIRNWMPMRERLSFDIRQSLEEYARQRPYIDSPDPRDPRRPIPVPSETIQ